MKFVRITEMIIGLIFILTALLKALDLTAFAMQVGAYGIVRDPALLRGIAIGATALEAALGALLVAGWRFKNLTWCATEVLLLGFAVLMAYGWLAHDLADCGCFGKYIELPPLPSIIKNLIMMGLLGAGWWHYRRVVREGRSQLLWSRTGIALALAGCMVVLTAGITVGFSETGVAAMDPQTSEDVASRPFAGFRLETDRGTIDLGTGEYLVVMLSATCEHCIGSVEKLNEMVELGDLPAMVCLMLGSPDGRDDFVAQTEPLFPCVPIDSLEFMNLIGDAPPRMYYVDNGTAIHHWDWQEAVPAPDDIQAAVDNHRNEGTGR